MLVQVGKYITDTDERTMLLTQVINTVFLIPNVSEFINYRQENVFFQTTEDYVFDSFDLIFSVLVSLGFSEKCD